MNHLTKSRPNSGGSSARLASFCLAVVLVSGLTILLFAVRESAAEDAVARYGYCYVADGKVEADEADASGFKIRYLLSSVFKTSDVYARSIGHTTQSSFEKHVDANYPPHGESIRHPVFCQTVFDARQDALDDFNDFIARKKRLGHMTTRTGWSPGHPEPDAAVAPQWTAKQRFSDCPDCPEMVVIPAGSFLMGSPASEEARRDEAQHQVNFDRPFALGVYEVTFAEWDACVSGGGCEPPGNDHGWGRGRRPAINVSWHDAQEYVAWLSGQTGKPYRLPSEAEWEYAARAGTTTPFHTGRTISTDQANYDGNYVYGNGRKGVYRGKTVAVGSFPANAFGLHDMHGNVWEWTEDCWNGSYGGAPSDGSAWVRGDCAKRVLRGGSWSDFPGNLRAAVRFRYTTGSRGSDGGFRVARTLAP